MAETVAAGWRVGFGMKSLLGSVCIARGRTDCRVSGIYEHMRSGIAPLCNGS